jgi:hypothetical protein
LGGFARTGRALIRSLGTEALPNGETRVTEPSRLRSDVRED